MQLKQVEYPRGNEKTINGQKLIFAPLPLGALEKYQKDLEANSVPIAVIIDVAHISLKRNYPDIKREYVADELLDIANMSEVLEIVIATSGLKHEGEKPEDVAGE